MMYDEHKLGADEKKLIRLHLSRPEVFVSQRLGWTPWEKQVEIMHSVRDNKETFVQSGNALGKTEISAAITLWWLLTRRGKVITTAPTWRQVKDLLWSKIGSMSRRVPGLGIDPLTADLKIEPEWYATGLSTRVADKFQGYHGNVLIIVDEACGVDNDDIWTAIDGNLTDAKHDRLLAVGNPTNPDTTFARKCSNPSVNRKVMVMSAFDCPNVKEGREVIPGLVTLDWVNQKAEEWGTNSPYYLARVLGQFPKTASDSLFPLSWLDYAFNYDTLPDKDGICLPDLSAGARVIGMDVAASGQDNNSLAYCTGGKVQRVAGWPGIDTEELVVGSPGINHPSLYDWIDLYNPESVYIDAVGVGYPIYREARKHKKSSERYRGVNIRSFIAQKVAKREDMYANTKAEAYVRFRELLRQGKVDMSSITGDMRATIEKQANAIRWEPDTKGRFRIEKKERMKARVGFSPDELESIIMAFYASNDSKVDPNAYRRFDYAGTEEHELVKSFDYGGVY